MMNYHDNSHLRPPLPMVLVPMGHPNYEKGGSMLSPLQQCQGSPHMPHQNGWVFPKHTQVVSGAYLFWVVTVIPQTMKNMTGTSPQHDPSVWCKVGINCKSYASYNTYDLWPLKPAPNQGGLSWSKAWKGVSWEYVGFIWVWGGAPKWWGAWVLATGKRLNMTHKIFDRILLRLIGTKGLVGTQVVTQAVCEWNRPFIVG